MASRGPTLEQKWGWPGATNASGPDAGTVHMLWNTVSREAMEWAFHHSKARTIAARFVLVVLAEHANARHEAWPAVSRIAGMTGLSERAVQYALRELEKLGEISIIDQGAPTQRADRRSNLYLLAVPERGAHTAPRRRPRGANDDTHGVQMTTPRGATAAPKPTTEPRTRTLRVVEEEVYDNRSYEEQMWDRFGG